MAATEGDVELSLLDAQADGGASASAVDPQEEFYANIERRNVFQQVYHIAREAYHPWVIKDKLFPTLIIRGLKVMGMACNQRVGKLLLGWNGHENRLYDECGRRVRMLYKQLYGHPPRHRDVRIFLHRRLHYAFITAVVTAIQIVLTYFSLVGVAIVLSVAVAPVTMIDRQWSTSVTKNVPRYPREVTLNKLQYPLLRVLERGRATASGSTPTADGRHYTPRKLKNPRWFVVLVFVEMFNGSLQFWAGALLFVMPVVLFFHHGWLRYNIGGFISTLTVLNVVRVVKEVTNWVSPLIERTTTPVKYEGNRFVYGELLAFLRSLGEERLDALLTGPCGDPASEVLLEQLRVDVEKIVDAEKLEGGGVGLSLPHYFCEIDADANDVALLLHTLGVVYYGKVPRKTDTTDRQRGSAESITDHSVEGGGEN